MKYNRGKNIAFIGMFFIRQIYENNLIHPQVNKSEPTANNYEYRYMHATAINITCSRKLKPEVRKAFIFVSYY